MVTLGVSLLLLSLSLRDLNIPTSRPMFWKVGNGKCPECNEMGTPCCACNGRVCKNGHLSVKSKAFSPCPRHTVLDIANKTTYQKLREYLPFSTTH